MASLKLLVAEDHIPSLELMAEVFTSLQAEVWPLSDSREAANLIGKEKFDGIFLDLEIPNIRSVSSVAFRSGNHLDWLPWCLGCLPRTISPLYVCRGFTSLTLASRCVCRMSVRLSLSF